MGKARKNRVRPGKAGDPLARPSKPPADPELAALREQKILPVLKDLQSAETKTRSLAATAIANMIDNDKCRRLLLREQLVPLIMNNTLTDSSPDSRAAGWEIIKAVAEREDAGFCIHLYRLDILTAIDFACKTVSNTLESKEPSFHMTTKAQQTVVWRISTSLCSLLGALAEAQDDIPEAISKNERIIDFLLGLLSRENVDPSTLDELLSCVMTLTEDNPYLGKKIADCSALETMLRLKNLDGSTSVLVCGVLHNVFSAMNWNDNSPGKLGATDEVLIRRLARTLQDYHGENAEVKEGEWDAPPGIVILALEILASIATTVQDTLGGDERPEKHEEVQAEEEEVDEEMHDDAEEEDGGDQEDAGANESDGDDESMDDEAIMEDMEVVLGSDDEDDARIDDLPTVESLLKKAMPQILRLIQLASTSEEDMRIKNHSVSVLNNLAWSLSCLDFSASSNAGVLKAWLPHAKTVWEKVITPILDADTEDLELATEVTSLAWALARAIRAELPLKENQHQKFISLYHAAKNLEKVAQNGDGEKRPVADDGDPFQTLGVKCIGILGQLALDPAPVSLNRDIGIFLITVISSLPQIPAAEGVEALNQILDIYADEEAACDKEVFWKDNFLKHLEDSIPKAKAMLKGIHKHDENTKELRARAEEVVMNLNRFVQYKKKHRPT